jgi:glycine oxidase
MKIAVLGSGLMGRVISMRLYQTGYNNITLIDRDNPEGKQSPAYIAAGMIAPFSESVMGGHTIYSLGKNSLSLWKSYLDNLHAPELYNDKGTLLFAPANFGMEIKHYINKISFNTNLNNYYQILDKLGITKLEPELKFNHAYYLADEGGLNAREIMSCLGNYLINRINWEIDSEISCHKQSNSITVNSLIRNFDFVIDCRGLGGREVYSNLRGIRGEIIRVYAPDVNIMRPIRLFHPRHSIYISPYKKHHYVIGATEIEAEDFSPISVRSSLELLSLAYDIHSGFAEARILEMNANCRPTLPNNLPQITAWDNFIAINGLYRHGFLLSPTLAEICIKYLSNGSKEYPQIWS